MKALNLFKKALGTDSGDFLISVKKNELNEAIKELEELNRSCDGCKYEKDDMPCLECSRCYHDKFEPKEQK